MSIERTAQLYRSLRLPAIYQGLDGLLAQAEANQLSYLQFAQHLAEHEYTHRNRRRIELNCRKAAFPALKSLEEFDYCHQTTITKRQVNALLDFGFIDNRQNLISIGPPDPST